MNRKAVGLALMYSIMVIAYKLIIVQGGFYLSKFGFYYSHVVSVFAAIPFFIIAIRIARRENGGFISGREAIRAALTVFGISAILISVYNYVEFDMYGKQLAIEYYNSNEFLEFLKRQDRIKPEDFDKIIKEQIEAADTSAFKATTSKLISMMIIGLSSSFVCAVFLKRNPAGR